MYRLLIFQPYVLPCVREAEKRLCCTQDHEYPSLIGIPDFFNSAGKFAWGDKIYNEKKDLIANAQAVSGSGSLRLLAQFLKNCNITGNVAYPNPTWTNQHTIFRNAGLNVSRIFSSIKENMLRKHMKHKDVILRKCND